MHIKYERKQVKFITGFYKMHLENILSLLYIVLAVLNILIWIKLQPHQKFCKTGRRERSPNWSGLDSSDKHFRLSLCLAPRSFLHPGAKEHSAMWEGRKVCISFVKWRKYYYELPGNFRQEHIWKLRFCKWIPFKLSLWYTPWKFFM